MSNTLKLLHQVRNTASTVAGSSTNPEHAALLAYVDMVMNELLLQESPAFYLEYIAKGKGIYAQGLALLKQMGVSLEAVALRDDLSEELRDEIFDAEIQKLHDALTQVVQALDENRSFDEKKYLVLLSEWENSLYLHRGEQAPNNRVDNTKHITRDMVQGYLEQKFPLWKNLKVTGFNALYGGFSKKTLLVETEDNANGQQSLVFRVEQPVQLLCYDGSDVAREYYMIKLMHRAGLPVAKPLWLEEDKGYLGGRFIVSGKCPGRVLGHSLGSEADLPAEVVDEMLACMYRMHQITLDPDDEWTKKSHLREWLPHKTITEATRYWVEVYIPREIEQTGIRVTPDLLRCMKWLQGNVPECDEPPVVLHMDYAFNNLLFEGNKVSAILDWETSRLGDPVDDIIWTQNNLEKLITMPEFLDRYKAATGRQITQYRVAYSWIVKVALTIVGSLNATELLNEDNAAPISFSSFPFKFMPVLSTNLNKLIETAEACKGS